MPETARIGPGPPPAAMGESTLARSTVRRVSSDRGRAVARARRTVDSAPDRGRNRRRPPPRRRPDLGQRGAPTDGRSRGRPARGMGDQRRRVGPGLAGRAGLDTGRSPADRREGRGRPDVGPDPGAAPHAVHRHLGTGQRRTRPGTARHRRPPGLADHAPRLPALHLRPARGVPESARAERPRRQGQAGVAPDQGDGRRSRRPRDRSPGLRGHPARARTARPPRSAISTRR